MCGGRLSTILKTSQMNHRNCNFSIYSSLIIWRRQWPPTPVLLPGKSHGWRTLVGCSPWGRKESDMTERLPFHFSLLCIGEGNGNPLQCSCLENPRDRGAWWAAVYGVAQSRTQLKRLSSSSSIIEKLCINLSSLIFFNTTIFPTLCYDYDGDAVKFCDIYSLVFRLGCVYLCMLSHSVMFDRL